MADSTATEILRAALKRASEYGAREVSLTGEGVSFVDALGGRHEALVGGRSAKVDVAGMRDALSANELRVWDRWRAADGEREFKGLGTWTIASEDEHGVTLRPKKAKAPCLEALIEPVGDGIARLRSLYLRGGIDVVVSCEGETRARDIALAISAERSILGLPTTLRLAPEQSYSWDRDKDQSLLQFGPDAFDPPVAEAGEMWAIEHTEGRSPSAMLLANDDFEGSRVSVSSPRGFNRWQNRLHGEALQKHLDERERPAVVVTVVLEKSVPVARVTMSSSLMASSTADETFPDSPWARHADRKEARKASRPSAPKTWHPTTEAVAGAFVARKAPRGYVSGHSLYFHGPVAYSVYDSNPVAALVDLPGKETAIFYGRSVIGGTKGAVVSMAQGDIRSAARGKGFHEFTVDQLTDFLAWGGESLDRIAGRFRRDKNEGDFPSGCKVDRRKLRAYFSGKLDERLADLDEAMKTEFATHRKAGAYLGLASLADDRDLLSALFGASLPEVGDAAEFRASARAEREAADRRQAELRERRKTSGPADEDEPSAAPRM